MSLIPHKTLRSRATDQEALAERARKLFTIPPEQILQTKVDFTVVGGQVVWDRLAKRYGTEN